jgi:hypothetical protein
LGNLASGQNARVFKDKEKQTSQLVPSISLF